MVTRGILLTYFVSFSYLCMLSIVTGCHGLRRAPNPGVRDTLLFRACSTGDIEQIRALLNDGANSNAREQQGETPLMYAAVENRTEVISLLIDHNAEVNAVSLNSETALSRAVGMSRLGAVNVLLDRGANIELGHPLIYAAGLGDTRMVTLLLHRGANVDAANTVGDTALLAAVSRRASIDTIRVLLDAGAAVDRANNQGKTPLSIARSNDDEPIYVLLSTRIKN
ncbi:MAG TPA: ankyrin repeat domain-containing protein [Pyrinomonadaceae bacterium]